MGRTGTASNLQEKGKEYNVTEKTGSSGYELQQQR